MPPVRRRPQPQSTKCRFADQHGVRCTRLATVDGQLCRQHAAALEAQPVNFLEGLFGAIDRTVTKRLRADPLTRPFANELDVGQLLRQVFQPRAHPAGAPVMPGQAGTPPRGRVYPPHQPPPPPGPTAEEVAVREALLLMGFERLEGLTAAAIKDRKRKLAKTYHPDTGSGDEAAMKRIMAAADLLDRYVAGAR